MRLRLKKQFTSAAVALAMIAMSANSDAAGPDGSYIVSSQVVSDTVVEPGTYVGDMTAESAGCSDGTDGTCQGGTCGTGQGGNCGGLHGLHGDGSHNGICRGFIGDDGLGASLTGGGGPIGCQPRKYDRPDLFYNYYSQGNCNRANAQMYISPQPVPPFVGHTFFTYQPFYPHEYMYWHKNRYHNSYDNGRGMNRTKALYYAPPIKTAVQNLYWNKLRLPR